VGVPCSGAAAAGNFALRAISAARLPACPPARHTGRPAGKLSLELRLQQRSGSQDIPA